MTPAPRAQVVPDGLVLLEDRREQREPGRGPLAGALVVLAQDDGDRLEREPLAFIEW